MHVEAWEFLSRYATPSRLSILDVGGRDVNSWSQGYSLRNLFPNAEVTVIDKRPGPNVDIVADALNWMPPHYYDRILCLEVFEHEERWRDLLGKLVACMNPTKKSDLIITCAAPGRAPHSGIEDGPLQPGEYYKNISADEMRTELRHWGITWRLIETRKQWVKDLYVYGTLRSYFPL